MTVDSDEWLSEQLRKAEKWEEACSVIPLLKFVNIKPFLESIVNDLEEKHMDVNNEKEEQIKLLQATIKTLNKQEDALRKINYDQFHEIGRLQRIEVKLTKIEKILSNEEQYVTDWHGMIQDITEVVNS